jgi:hypothetical protein
MQARELQRQGFEAQQAELHDAMITALAQQQAEYEQVRMGAQLCYAYKAGSSGALQYSQVLCNVRRWPCLAELVVVTDERRQ